MSPATIALIFQILDLAIKEAPELFQLVTEFKNNFCKSEVVQITLKQLTDSTLETSNSTLAVLAPLLKGAK